MTFEAINKTANDAYEALTEIPPGQRNREVEGLLCQAIKSIDDLCSSTWEILNE